jgi:hypothetical protein
MDRTIEQFEEIADSRNANQWTQAAREAVDYGFWAGDMIKLNEETGIFRDPYDIAIIAEMAMKIRCEAGYYK